MKKLFLLFVTGFLILCQDQAWAWGRQGHLTVAIVAQSQLKPATISMINELRHTPNWQSLLPGRSKGFKNADKDLIRFMGQPEVDLSLISTWADEWRAHHRETGPLHYVNLSIKQHQDESTLLAECGKKDCVLSKIESSQKILSDRTDAPLAR